MTKKFANLHYPGMKSDPNEGRVPLSEQALRVFDLQIKAVGEDAQRVLASSSALVLGASPLGVRIARRLLEAGIGRVGLFGDQPISSAHLLKDPDDVADLGAIDGLKRDIKSLWSWGREDGSGVSFEPFSKLSLDRQFDDIARGFQWFIVDMAAGTENTLDLAEVIEYAKKYDAGIIIGRVHGAEFLASMYLPPAVKKLSAEDLRQKFSAQVTDGVLYSALDLLAAKISHALISTLVQGRTDESFDL